jgi:hypothetical protein
MWTPRYLSPEVRELKVAALVGQTYPACDGATNNDTIGRKFGMNLYQTFSTTDKMQLGQPIKFDVDVMHTGTIRPTEQGSLLRFDLFKDGGSSRRAEDQPISYPGGPDSPDEHGFTWTPTAVDCDPNLEVLYARSTVDHNGKYIETSETDNEKRINLPDLVPTGIRQETVGCESRLILTVEDKSEAPRIAPGLWNGKVTLTGPDGHVTTFDLTNMSGAGDFNLTALTSQTFPAGLAGTYKYEIEIDTSTASECGDILESNEGNNHLEGSWVLCPDPALGSGDLVAKGRVQRGVETEFVATIQNRGTLSLRRDVKVRLGTRDGKKDFYPGRFIPQLGGAELAVLHQREVDAFLMGSSTLPR